MAIMPKAKPGDLVKVEKQEQGKSGVGLVIKTRPARAHREEPLLYVRWSGTIDGIEIATEGWVEQKYCKIITD